MWARNRGRIFRLLAVSTPTAALLSWNRDSLSLHAKDAGITLSNWAGTLHATPTVIHRPSSEAEIVEIFLRAYNEHRRIRIIGNALSPNGLALHDGEVLSLENFDKILRIDEENLTVTVQPGATVRELNDTLAAHGLALPSYASIDAQQIGGVVSVGAHGSSFTVPPIDQSVTGIRIVSPTGRTYEIAVNRRRFAHTRSTYFSAANPTSVLAGRTSSAILPAAEAAVAGAAKGTAANTASHTAPSFTAAVRSSARIGARPADDDDEDDDAATAAAVAAALATSGDANEKAAAALRSSAIDRDVGDLLATARLSLGALGAITEVTLKVVPLYTYVERVRTVPRSAVTTSLLKQLSLHANAKLFWFPYSDTVAVITHDALDDDGARSVPRSLTDHLLRRRATRKFRDAYRIAVDPLAAFVRRTASDGDHVIGQDCGGIGSGLGHTACELAVAQAGGAGAVAAAQPNAAAVAAVGGAAASAAAKASPTAAAVAAAGADAAAAAVAAAGACPRPRDGSKYKPLAVTATERAAALRPLAEAVTSVYTAAGLPPPPLPSATSDAYTYTALRDLALAAGPTSTDVVTAVNRASASYFERLAAVDDGSGGRALAVGLPGDLLLMDCGSPQWTSEVAMACGAASAPSGADIEFAKEALRLLESLKVPLPCPVEHRWSVSSRSPLSPAYSEDAGRLFGWVGFIFYLPPSCRESWDAIRKEYSGALRALRPLWCKYGLRQHWAKEEGTGSVFDSQEEYCGHMHGAAAVPLGRFTCALAALDPAGVLWTGRLPTLFPGLRVLPDGTKQVAAAAAPAAAAAEEVAPSDVTTSPAAHDVARQTVGGQAAPSSAGGECGSILKAVAESMEGAERAHIAALGASSQRGDMRVDLSTVE